LTTTDEIGSTYDAEANVLTLTARGTTTLDWSGEGLIPPGATYAPIAVTERTAGPFHDAPFALVHPVFNRQLVIVRLPDGGRGFRVSGGQFDRTELGYHMSRSLRIDGETATIEVLVRSLVPEITAAEAEAGRLATNTRPADYPRIIAPTGYRLTDADQAALSADIPTTESGWLDRAYALSRAGDNPGALDAAEQAVLLAPDSAAAFANRGVYKFWAGDREGAEVDLNRAVELDPSERIAMNGNALLANAEGRYQDVVIEMSRALRQVPADTFALNLRGRAYLAQGQYDRALRDIDALIAAAPSAVASKLLRLTILGVAEREPELNSALTDILQQHPDDPRVVGTVAAYRLQQDNAQESWDILDGLIRRQPQPDPELLIQRAEAAIKLDRIDDAIADFALVRAASPDNPGTLNGLCWTAALAGIMLDQALQDCDAALTLAPGSSAILDSKARVLLQQGKAAEALEIYDAALTKTPDLPASLYGRGLARIALGRTEEGEADKAAAIALYAGSAEAFENYAPVAEAARP
ncbi:MAG: tetratricopeptide repeat protein, partial [Brevundimonas sp.]